MTRTINFRVSAASFDNELAKALREARAAVYKAEQELVRKFASSDRFQAARDVAGYGNSMSKSEPHVRIDGDHIAVSLYVDDDSALPAGPAPIFIDPKLANTLLHGKILTDAEKRDLVARLVPGLKMETAE